MKKYAFPVYLKEHEGPLTAVNISDDGLFVLAGTKTVSQQNVI